MLRKEYKDIHEEVDTTLKRHLELASENGASAWLSALPIQSLGYVLNKQQFRDSICLRYGWHILNTPTL